MILNVPVLGGESGGAIVGRTHFHRTEIAHSSDVKVETQGVLRSSVQSGPA